METNFEANLDLDTRISNLVKDNKKKTITFLYIFSFSIIVMLFDESKNTLGTLFWVVIFLFIILRFITGDVIKQIAIINKTIKSINFTENFVYVETYLFHFLGIKLFAKKRIKFKSSDFRVRIHNQPMIPQLKTDGEVFTLSDNGNHKYILLSYFFPYETVKICQRYLHIN